MKFLQRKSKSKEHKQYREISVLVEVIDDADSEWIDDEIENILCPIQENHEECARFWMITSRPIPEED